MTDTNAPIDWTKPIEDMDGTPCTLTNSMPDDHPAWPGWKDIKTNTGDRRSVLKDGSAIFPGHLRPFAVRNVTSPEVSDTGGHLPAALVERMVALVRKVATWTWVAHTDADKDYAEARAIVAEVKPADEDLAFARAFLGDVAENVQAFPESDMAASYRKEGTDSPTQFTRRLADKLKSVRIEGRSPIAAELPKPVDADLLIVRRIVADALTGKDIIEGVLAGDQDNAASITVPLECLRRGRQLEREGK